MRAAPGGRHHGAVEPPPRRENARRVDKHELGLPSIAMPRNSVRVVCTLGVTMATLLPTRALISVDLPALGAPISAMKPQRVAAPSSAIGAIRPHALALEHGGGGGLLGACAWSGRALRPARGSAARRPRGIPDRGAGRCARPRDRPASAGRAPAPIPAGWSWGRATAAPARACARPTAARPACGAS